MSLKFTRHVRIAIGITIAVTALSAFAAQTCIIDNLRMIWTGDTVVEGGKLLYVVECPQGHRALALSPN